MECVIYKRPKIPTITNINVPDDEFGFLKQFEETLKNTSFDLSLFYANCVNLKMVKDSHLEESLFATTDAEYNMLFNCLSYNPQKYQLGLFHEIFHMASNIVGKRVIHNGLSQIQLDKNFVFGVGIKEAYTCILDLRYFGNEEKKEYYRGIYPISRTLVELLEKLLGRDNMERWYSQADLQSLVEALSKYFGRNMAIRFIDAIDKISYYNEYGRYINPLTSILLYRFALTFLGRCFMKKNAKEYNLDGNTTNYRNNLEEVREIMDKRIIYPVPFKIIKSRKYTDKKFKRDLDIIEKKVLKNIS